jgi:hypothetical protein
MSALGKRKKVRIKGKRRRGRSNRSKQFKSLLGIIGVGLLVVILVTGLILNRVFKIQPAEPEIPPVETPATEQPLHPRLIPLLQTLEAYAPLQPGTPVPARALADTILLIPAINITGDSTPARISGILPDEPITLDRNLRGDGFTDVVRAFIVTVGDKTMLRVDEYAIRDHMNRRIISQMPANSGYAFRIYEFTDEWGDTPYTGTINLIDLVIIDEFGRAMSDAITIYWNPLSETFSATNTFGAPGTFN